MRLDILNRLGMDHECDRQTGGRTDGRTDRQNRRDIKTRAKHCLTQSFVEKKHIVLL